MPKSYQQNCSLAFALDQLGERWTLLIIRELLGGPRRFGDLMVNLPGIGPNLLTKRLNELKSRDLVVRKKFVQPMAFQGWELTPSGYDLEDAVVALAKWGLRSYSQSYSGDNHWSAHWNFLACQARFQPKVEFNETIHGHITVDGFEHSLTFFSHDLKYGHVPKDQCHFAVEAEGKEFAALFAEKDREKAVKKSKITITGDMEAFAKTMACFL